MALTTSLISFWQLEETSGTRFDAVVASGNNLTDNNTVTSAVGRVGTAGQFTAANSEYLSHASNAGLQAGPDLTLQAWIFTDDTMSANRVIFNKDNDGVNPSWYLVGQATNKITGVALSDDATTVTASTPDNAVINSVWAHVVMTYDSSDKKVRVMVNNSTPVVSAALPLGIDTNGTGEFRIGQFQSGSQFFNGRLDQMGLWQRVLTAAEITALYNSGFGLSYSQMISPTLATIDYTHFPPVNL